VTECFSDIIGTYKDSSTSSKEYFLQQESSEWGGLIDITGFVKDKETIKLCYSSNSKEACAEVDN